MTKKQTKLEQDLRATQDEINAGEEALKKLYAKRDRLIRRALKTLSQAKIAALIGVSRSAIYKLNRKEK